MRLNKLVISASLLAILCLLPLFIKSAYYLHIFIIAFIYIIASVSLRTIAISGQISLGHAAFMGIGAYTSSVIAKELDWTPWITIPIGGLSAMVIGIIIGYAMSRLRTIYFTVASLFFGMAMMSLVPLLGELTGGYTGLIGIPPLFSTSKVPYYYFILAVTVFSLTVLYRFEFCRIGMSLKAIHQSQPVAISVGLDVSGYKVLALSVGCLFAGIAGATYANYSLVISPEIFGLLPSINLVVYVLVGGLGSFAGPIIGAATLVIIPELFRMLKEFTPYIYAVITLVVVFVMPQGLAGLFAQIKSYIIKLRMGAG